MRKEFASGAFVKRDIGSALIRKEEGIAGDDGNQAHDEGMNTGRAGNRSEGNGDERGGRLPPYKQTNRKAEHDQTDNEHGGRR